MGYKERVIFSISAEGAEITKAQINAITTSFKDNGIQVDKVTTATTKGTQAFGRMNTSMVNLLGNAVKWALAYKILYTAINMVTQFITGSIKAWTDLDEVMARVRTVTRDMGEGLPKIMRVFSREVQSYAMDSRESINDIGSVLYWLGTAGLNVQEQLGGIAPVMDLVTGTMGNTTEIARLLAGTYNTLGDTVEGATSTQDKFRKMSDIMAYTFSKEEMELSDLASAMQYVAGDAKNVGLNFNQLVTIIGFLNTHLLKGSKSGMSLSQSFVQILKNSEKLVNKLGVTFEKDKPYIFLDVMDKIVGALDKIGINSARSQTILSSIFGARSIRPIQRMVANWDLLKESIKKAEVESVGFAEKLKEIRMDTINAQTSRMNNIIQVSAQNFLSAALGAGDMVDALKLLNERLKDVPTFATRAGIALKTFGQTEISKVTTPKLGMNIFPMLLDPVSLYKFFLVYQQNMEKQQKLSEETIRERMIGVQTLNEFEERNQKVTLDYEKERQEGLRSTLEIMKIMGASEITILQQELDLTEQIMDEDARLLEQSKIKNKLYETSLKLVEDIANIEMEHALDMSKIAGATDIEIAKEKLKYARQLEDPLNRQKETIIARNEVERVYLEMLAKERDSIDANVAVLTRLLGLSKQFGKEDIAKQLIDYTLGRKKYTDLSSEAQGQFSKYFPAQAQTEKVKAGLGGLGYTYEELEKNRDLNLRREQVSGRLRAQATPEIQALLKAEVETKSKIDVNINVDKKQVLGLLKSIGWEAMGDSIKDYVTKTLTSAEFNSLIKSKIENHK